MTTWSQFCKQSRYYPTVGMRLDISAMNLGENFFAANRERQERTLAEMKALEAGAIANPDEGRMVGHYWLRSSALAPNATIKREIDDCLVRVKAFADDIRSGKLKAPDGEMYSDILLIGIGGSALGPQLIADALGGKQSRLTINFLDNTDPEGMRRVFDHIGERLGHTLVLVTSKSGGTIETRNGLIETQAEFKRRQLRLACQAVAITCVGSKLDQIAQSEGWLERFPMWDYVGGRVSISSVVGLLPAALLGVDIDQFLAGACEMDKLTRASSDLDNPALSMALVWHFVGQGVGKKDLVVLPYKDKLGLFGKYLQQLIMESLGKRLDLEGNAVHQGLSVYGNKGSTDQHAYVQQLRDGLNNFFVTFIEVLRDQVTDIFNPCYVEEHITSGDYLDGYFQGTRAALAESGRSSLTISVDTLDAFRMGAIIALFERTVGYYATLININAYHQPGVEAGKLAANEVIKLEKQLLGFLRENVAAHKFYDASTLAQIMNKEDSVFTVFKILDRLALNPYSQIESNGQREPEKAAFRCAPSN